MPDPKAIEHGDPACAHCVRLAAERDHYRKALVEMAYSAGWPEQPEAHLKELQKEASKVLSVYSPFRWKSLKPWHAPLPPETDWKR